MRSFDQRSVYSSSPNVLKHSLISPVHVPKYRVHVCEDRGRRGRMEAGLLSQIGAKLRKYETDHVLKQNYFQTRELYY